MRLRGVVFDMDQTLYDRPASDRIAMARYFADQRERFAETCTEGMAIESMVRADHDEGHFGWDRILSRMVEDGIFRDPPETADICAFFQKEFSLEGVLFPSTKQTLKELKELGLSVAMITNGNEQSQMKKIRGLGIEECFDRIIVGSDIETRKPNKAIFLEMADKLHAKPEELLYVGDNPLNDVKGARDAGYVPVWIATMPWDYPEIEKAPYTIFQIEEIVPLARMLLKGQK